jgi:superfamily II DNA/RNA helicase
MAIYFTFCEKRYGILLCTNIAARGLDFPLVDLIQFDIPGQTQDPVLLQPVCSEHQDV